MHRIFLESKFIYMALTTVLLMTILFTSATASSVERYHARRFFGNDKPSTTITDESSFGGSFSDWLNGFLSGGSNKDKDTDSFSKLALLKNFLSSSSSSSSSDKNSKLDKLFKILIDSATDDNNLSSSSSNKLNRLLGFFNSYGSSSSSSSSSNNLQLAMKLLNLAQGNGGLSSFSVTDLQSLTKFISG